MLDCTRCRRAAARVMPPDSATAWKIRNDTKSTYSTLSTNLLFSICEETHLNYSFFMNARSIYTASMSPAAVAAAGLAALVAGMGIGRFAFTPILPLMQAEGTLTLARGGSLPPANYAGYLAGALTATRVPAATAVRAGLAGTALFTLAMGLDAHFAGWVALRAAAGAASAWVLIHVSAWSLERLAPLSRPALSGVVYAGVGAGAALAGGVCLAVLQLHLTADDAWIALGLIALAVAVLLWPAFAGEARSATRPSPF